MRDFVMKQGQTIPEQTDQHSRPEDEREIFTGDCPKYAQEINGPKGPEPTRFGDWERKGRCVDF